VALRWRTEAEVLSGAGEETCGNTRCAYHEPQSERDLPPLATLEVPFAYSEHGEAKSALVKLVLCERCSNKLLWKRRKEKAAAMGKEVAPIDSVDDSDDEDGTVIATERAISPRSGSEQKRHSTNRQDYDTSSRDRYHRGEQSRRSLQGPSSRGRAESDHIISGQRRGHHKAGRHARSVQRRSASPELRARDDR
jgi:protein FRA10AC1